MRRGLLIVVALVSGCAARPEKPSASPATMPAEPSSAPGAGGLSAPSPATGTTSTGAEEEDKAVAPPPPTGPAATSTPTGGAPATKAPSAAPKPAPVAPGTDAGGSSGKPPSIGAAQAAFDDARKTFVAAADCMHMCKALASMTNATDHLCQLTQGGSEQKRCTDAKAKLGAAEAKVKATCGGCT